MSVSHKVFIYYGNGTSLESASDLKDLLENDHLSFGHPDVTISDYQFNHDQLKAPQVTFVIPGGSTLAIGFDVKNKFDLINNEIGTNYNFIGICAGGFLGVTQADLFGLTHKNIAGYYEPPQYILPTQDLEVNLSLSNACKAIGAFYPIDKISEGKINKKYVPHCVSMTQSDGPTFSALYVNGPAFVETVPGYLNIHASYSITHPISFNYEPEYYKVKQFDNLH